ncbi:unnamed protein product [Protopolystoma xenopodis]|uniref:Uncharacterized protein n=1 Tax=Protopolystoma xenopodis TaxID=117903 RepID=A0A3S5A575_9PLAT|nr:unnamed protein product [Protopolystoma xenopodis]
MYFTSTTPGRLDSLYQKPGEFDNNLDNQYGVIIDAGSSGSRMFVYTWPKPSGNKRELLNIYLFNDKEGIPVVKKMTPGLSSFGNNLSGIAKYLSPLLDLAVKNIPQEKHKETPIYILATAGMRLLPEKVQSEIWSVVRLFIVTKYDFIFSEHNAKTISGADEGMYGWIAVNYLLRRFDQSHRHSDSSEMGVSCELRYFNLPHILYEL